MGQHKFSLINRLLHWAIAFTMLFLLLTVFLRQGWLNKDSVGQVVKTELSKKDITLTDKEAAQIGREVRRMWRYHIWAGYVLIGLYALRIIVTLKQGIQYPNPFVKQHTTANKFKSWLYTIFYILLGVSLITGFIIVNGPKALKEPMEAVHVQSLYYVLIFITLHIGGVLIADSSKEKGLISKMISGDK